MSDCAAKNPTTIESMFAGFDNPEDRSRKWQCPNVSWQSSPLAITSVITKVISQYFSDTSRFPNDAIYKLIEDNIPVVTQLDSSDPKETGKLPKVVVEFVGSSMAERDFGKNNRIDYNIHNSQGTYYAVWNVQNRVDIIAKTKHEAMLLAESICFLFAHYKTVMLKILLCHDFRVTRFQGAKLVSEDNPSYGYMASVELLTIAPDGWHLVEAAPRLKRVMTTI